MHNMRPLLFAVTVIFPTSIFSQEVINSWFCINVENNECIHRIADGTEIVLSALSNENGNPALYFWGAIKSSDNSVATIYFSRESPCSVEQIRLPREKFESQRNLFQEAWAFLSNLRGADIWDRLGISSIEASTNRVDIKLNLVSIASSPRFRIHDFRNVTCPSVLRARLFDSQGEPLPGNNDVRSVRIVD